MLTWERTKNIHGKGIARWDSDTEKQQKMNKSVLSYEWWEVMGTGEKIIFRLLQFCIKIEKNEMGWACRAYGGEERHIQSFGGETWGKETTWETQA